MNTVLIVEDEERISAFVAKGLRAAGYQALVASTVAQARRIMGDEEIDLMVLDLGLPDGEGMDVVEAVRGQGSSIPVIVLTARTSIDDTVASLEGGADDYMAKPFRFEELLARIRLRLRSAVSLGPSAAEAPLTRLRAGDLEMDLVARKVHLAGREVELSTREFELAATFVRHPGQALTREQLLSRVWGYDFDPGSNVVDVYVRYLRRKLGPDRFATVRGVGYRFEG